MYFQLGGPIIFHRVLYSIDLSVQLSYGDKGNGEPFTQTKNHRVFVEAKPPDCYLTDEQFKLVATKQEDITVVLWKDNQI